MDLDCGNVALCKKLLDLGYSVVSIDDSSEAISCARKRLFRGSFLEVSIYDDLRPDFKNHFDVVIATEVIRTSFVSTGAVASCEKVS